MKTIQKVVVGALAVMPALACGVESGSTAWAGEVTDSAGVAVVRNAGEGLWGDTPSWHLEEVFRVGGLEADATAQFGSVIGLDTDATGRVYVADQQTREIQVFEADGTHVMTFGAPGQGPGEFGPQITGVFVSGDAIRVPDITNGRVSVFALDGEYDSAIGIDLTKGIPIRWDETMDGDMVAQLRGISMEPGEEGTLTGGDAIVVVRDDASRDTVAVLPAGQSFTMRGGVPSFKLFEAEPSWDLDDNAATGRLAMGMSTDYRIELRENGELKRIITMPFDRKEISQGDQTRVLQMMRKLMLDQGAPPPAVEQMIQATQFADFYPAFAQIVNGPQGTTWVQQLRTPDEVADDGTFDLQDLGSPRWHVFDADGRFLGQLTMPQGFQPYRLIGDVFYGVERDDFDVQSVVGFRLVTG